MASDTQEILGVGTPFCALKCKGFTDVGFRSATSFMDYDAVVIDTSCLAEKYETNYLDYSFQGKRKISTNDSIPMKEEFGRTKIQIIDFLKQGKNARHPVASATLVA